MPLLARPTSRPPRPHRKPAFAPPPMAMLGAGVEVIIADAPVTALPDGALWIADAKTLVVSDLHLEKGSAFALGGQMLPPYDTHATLSKLAALMDTLAPDIVVSLGDSFHDGGGPARMDAEDRARLHGLIARADWIWIEGNHDGRAPETLGGALRETLQIGALVLRHEPGGAANEVAGHLHPCARVAGRGRSVRRRCFATDGARLIMPAFGAFTGGLNVCGEAFAGIFSGGFTALVLAKDCVLPVAQERLLGD
ncbi:MAG: ligase-associated DNA damage response endonuclease PdeM [Hyphomonadaceae bacterium]